MDEADRMLEEGFAAELNDLKSIRKKDESSMYIADVLVVSKNNDVIKEALGNYPKEVTEKVIYTDAFKKNVK